MSNFFEKKDAGMIGKIRSFDVFDTLLTRKVGLPNHIFLLMGIKANDWSDFHLDPEIFVEERIKAEKQLKGVVKIPDIYAIYGKLAENLNLSRELSEKLLGLELDTEMENLVPVQTNVDQLKKMRREGAEIIYISDMYLNEMIIRKILTEHGILLEGERIYASCEYGISKKSGLLFNKVTEDLGIEKRDLHHFGNSNASDIRGAKIAGIDSTLLPDGNLNRYERTLCTLDKAHPITPERRLYYSRMAASSRIARLSNTRHNKQIYEVSASVAAPILYLFVTFLLEKAEGERLYFLSRDGYILYNIARKIAVTKGFEADLRYLYISREALCLTKFTKKPDEGLLNCIKNLFGRRSVNQLLGKLSVREESIRLSSISQTVLEKEISALDTDVLTSVLHNEHIFSDMKSDAQRRKKLLHAYLEKEGLFETEKVNLVDVGWDLTIHDLFVDLFREKNLSPPNGYYFGINRANSFVNHGKRTGFLWDLRKNGFSVNIPRKTRIIEVFCSAPHGQTVDYKETNGGIEPVFNEYETRHLMDWGIKGMEEAILCFSEEMAVYNNTLESREWDRFVCSELMETFWMKPTREEVRVWGEYPFFISGDQSRIINLHRKKPSPQLIFDAFKNMSLPKEHEDSWPVAHYYSLKPLHRVLVKLLMRSRKYIHRYIL